MHLERLLKPTGMVVFSRDDAIAGGPQPPTVEVDGETHRPSFGEVDRSEVSASQGDSPRTNPALSQLRSALGENAALLDTVLDTPDRAPLLDQQDRIKSGTTLDHILRLAVAGTKGNAHAMAVAKQLLNGIGGGVAATHGKCFGRTMFSILGHSLPAEQARVVADVVLNGEARMASGLVVRDAEPRQGADWICGMIARGAKEGGAGKGPISLRSVNQDYAHKGQMANIMTHWTGVRHVNATGLSTNAQGIKTLGAFAQENWPLLVEYSAHGGGFFGEGSTASSI